MKCIKKPTFNVRSVFRICFSRYYIFDIFSMRE